MRTPITLRNIPPSALHIAGCLCQQTSLSMADLLRQALVSGLLVEATRFAPAPDGTLGGKEPAWLAKALRRHLGSAIDLLLEYGELPYQGMKGSEAKPEQRPMLLDTEDPAVSGQEEEPGLLLENTIEEDLDILGIGMSLAATLEGEKASAKPSA